MQAADGGRMLLVLFQGFQPNMQRDQRSLHLDIQEAEREGVGEARREGEHVLKIPMLLSPGSQPMDCLRADLPFLTDAFGHHRHS